MTSRPGGRRVHSGAEARAGVLRRDSPPLPGNPSRSCESPRSEPSVSPFSAKRGFMVRSERSQLATMSLISYEFFEFTRIGVSQFVSQFVSQIFE
jgi:hypothetical protein